MGQEGASQGDVPSSHHSGLCEKQKVANPKVNPLGLTARLRGDVSKVYTPQCA
jgi:hypothetical protein